MHPPQSHPSHAPRTQYARGSLSLFHSSPGTCYVCKPPSSFPLFQAPPLAAITTHNGTSKPSTCGLGHISRLLRLSVCAALSRACLPACMHTHGAAEKRTKELVHISRVTTYLCRFYMANDSPPPSMRYPTRGFSGAVFPTSLILYRSNNRTGCTRSAT